MPYTAYAVASQQFAVAVRSDRATEQGPVLLGHKLEVRPAQFVAMNRSSVAIPADIRQVRLATRAGPSSWGDGFDSVGQCSLGEALVVGHQTL